LALTIGLGFGENVPPPWVNAHVTVPFGGAPETPTTSGIGRGVLINPLWLSPDRTDSAVEVTTTRLKDVVLLRGLPVTVMENVPAGVDAAVVIVKVVEQVAVQEAGENAGMAPLGSPDRLKLTSSGSPPCSVAVMVVAPEAPAVTVTLPELVSA
jgi:hypothetical protein